MAAFVPEYLAHLWLRLSCLLVMHQAAVLDGSALDALTLQQNGLPPAEIYISRGQVFQALMAAPVVILRDKLLDLGLQRARQVVILQQDVVLHGLVPAFDLALCLGMCGRTADMLYERGMDKSHPLPRRRVRSIPQHFKPIALVFAPPLLHDCLGRC